MLHKVVVGKLSSSWEKLLCYKLSLQIASSRTLAHSLADTTLWSERCQKIKGVCFVCDLGKLARLICTLRSDLEGTL